MKEELLSKKKPRPLTLSWVLSNFLKIGNSNVIKLIQASEIYENVPNSFYNTSPALISKSNKGILNK